ncbi:hypothetical protein Tco_1577683 [Tanacetum coccineum]
MNLDAGISLVPPHVEVQGRYGHNLDTQEGFGAVAGHKKLMKNRKVLLKLRGKAKMDELSPKEDETDRAAKADEDQGWGQCSCLTKRNIQWVKYTIKNQEEFYSIETIRRHSHLSRSRSLEEPVKRQKIGEASGSGEESAEKEKELSEEELQKLLVIVLVEEVYVEALQVKYPIIDWEVYFEDTRRDDLVKLWDLVKEESSVNLA